MKKKIIISSAIITAFLLAAAAFLVVQTEKPDSPFFCRDCNVILITLTNLRYDHLSQNGYFRSTSPNLDAFAEESLVFDNAFSHSSWTLPESISIYASLYPFQHGVMNRYDGGSLPRNIPTLVDSLNNNGYLTAIFTGGFDYDPLYGLTNRFGEYRECADSGSGEKRMTILEYGKIQCTLPEALRWIKDNSNKKFFIQIQGYDVHCPFSQQGGHIYDEGYEGIVDFSSCLWTFDKTEPIVENGETYYPVYSPKTEGRASILLNKEDVNHLVALYDESITLSDELLGFFFKEIEDLGLWGNTIVIFTSEHGDMLGKDGRFMRGGPVRGTFYDDVLHTPLIIKHPKLEPRRVEGLIGHIDIAPTLLDFLGIKKPLSFQGKSLLHLILENSEVSQYVFSGTEYDPGEDNIYFEENTRIEAIRSKKWKLIKETFSSGESSSFGLELYDLENDKDEIYNLADGRKDILDFLLPQLESWSDKMRRSR